MSVERDAAASDEGRDGSRGRVFGPFAGEPGAGRWMLRLAGATALTGLGAGLAGALFWALLHGVRYVAFGPAAHGLSESVAGVPLVRLLLAPLVAGVATGVVWRLLRRRDHVVPVTTVLHEPHRRLVFVPTWLDAILQTIVVGAGASIGREGAPRQGAAAVATWVCDWFGLDDRERRVLVAAGAGAGLAAVYNVPVTGAIYVLEVLLLSRHWRIALTAAVTSAIATVTAWPVVGRYPVYPFPTTSVSTATWVAALLAVPLTVAVGLLFARSTSVSRHLTVHRSALLPLTLALAGAATGLVSWRLPQVVGNGKAILDAAFATSLPLAAAAALILVKPAVTAGWLWAGAAGGLLTPALATGGALGTAVALAAAATGHPVSVPQVALIMAVGVLAVTQRAPFFAASFGIELTHPPLLLALVVLATALSARTVAQVACRASTHRP